MSHRFARFAGTLALLAGPLSWVSLVVGLLAVQWNFDTYGDPPRLLEVGATAATQIQWSYWLSSFGSYLLLLPMLLWLHRQLSERDELFAHWYALCGLGYLLLGGVGAAILASLWPFLIRLHQEVGSANTEQLSLLIQFSTALAEGGLQGLIQNTAGGVWWLGVGIHVWSTRRAFSSLNMVISGALFLTALGGVLGVEALTMIGLIITLLLVPIWSIWAGLLVLRSA